MKIEDTSLKDFKIIIPDIFLDSRGFFLESYNIEKFKKLGITNIFNQDNHSHSSKNTLRGLHFQTMPGQAKLVRVIKGSILDVAVDIRESSPDYGKWHSVEISSENNKIAYIPVGFAHGFCVLSETADVLYKVSSVYNAETEAGLAWDDPDINIQWPVLDPVLSERDKKNRSFCDYKKAPIFK